MEPTENEHSTEKRRPGAQPGNKNALKHGFYSTLMLPEEKQFLETDNIGRLADEINIMRALLFRTVKAFNENPPTTFIDRVHALRAISFAVSSLQGIYSTKRSIERRMMFPDQNHVSSLDL